MKSAAAWLITLGSIILLWQACLTAGLVSRAALAGPFEVARSMPEMFRAAANQKDLLSTLRYSLTAFILSAPIGVIAGYVVGSWRTAGRPLEFILDFLRSIPATALVPVFLILIGINNTTKVAVGAFSSALVIAVSVIAGLASRSRTRSMVASILQLRRAERLLLVDLPETLPHIFVGLRAGISLALILVVVSEMMIGGDRGLGKVIADMRYTDDKPRLYAAIVTTGGIGYFFNLALRAAEHRILHWRGLGQ